MTNKVFHVNLGINMNGFSTITQKGQVAIPKAIRDYFNIKPSDKIYFEAEFSDDPGTIYQLVGYRYTGLAGDQP